MQYLWMAVDGMWELALCGLLECTPRPLGDGPCLLTTRQGVTCAGVAQTAGRVPKDATRRPCAARDLADSCRLRLRLVRLLLCGLGRLIRVSLGLTRCFVRRPLGLVRFLVAPFEATQGLPHALPALQPRQDPPARHPRV